ncbi:checkpoint clamp complex protein Rad1 [Kalmusia sp. IMI 367209]|nr:checkpoint clamp complex protein Rad1 [Kalmusia sp. IMI 367209]
MSTPLLDVWEAAAASPYHPSLSKDSQFTVGALLLLIGQAHTMDEEDELPILTAVSSSARQLYSLLRCISFSEKAHVEITDGGLKFSVDEASVMEGTYTTPVLLAESFISHVTSSQLTLSRAPAPPPPPQHEIADSDEEQDLDPEALPIFQISLPALLETLQIFGLTDPNTSKPPWARDNPTSTAAAFSNNVLGMNNMCRIAYDAPGSPLTVILTEATIRTTSHVAFKTIMRGTWLFDAISELSSTSPEKLTLWARNRGRKPYFALSSSGTLGSARVEFNNDAQARAVPPPTNGLEDQSAQASLLETFQLGDPSSTLRASYKFSLIQRAARAMSVATKVSVRVDEQDVLSLQFMIEVEPGKLSFVDFRFVPLVEGDDEGDETMVGDVGAEDSGSGTDDEGEP